MLFSYTLRTHSHDFMADAEFLSGAMEYFEGKDLWSLGQQSLALMRKFLTGGGIRSKASRWLRSPV